jgi:ABC-type multidrug transport system ATPase subunit
VTTHQPEEAERCHRIAILDGGPRRRRRHARAAAGPRRGRRRARARRPARRAARDDRVASGVAGRVVDGDVVVETPRGHEVVPRIAELFPAGRIAALATSRPTLADVFAKLTGKGLAS